MRAHWRRDLDWKEAERMEWMREANTLLLKAGITDGSAEAIRAFEAGDTPSEFVNALIRGPA